MENETHGFGLRSHPESLSDKKSTLKLSDSGHPLDRRVWERDMHRAVSSNWDLDTLPVSDDQAALSFHVHPAAYADEELYELEIEHIFSKTWVFLGLESEVSKPHDFLTGRIARSPVLVTRDATGTLHGFLNVCRHKGALLCRPEAGNARAHVCPYHHWSFSSAGRLIGMKAKNAGGYTESFAAEDHDLLPIGAIASYRGLIFGSLSSDVPALDDYLGDMRLFIDLVMDQGPLGMEFVPGRAPYTFKANWKMQLDNGLDPYHVTSTHKSLLDLQRRRTSNDDTMTIRSRDWERASKMEHHYFNFEFGHSAFVEESAEPEKRPLYRRIDELVATYGEFRARQMLNSYQLNIFPNLQIATSIAGVVRRFDPIAVDTTEMSVRCLAAIGESAEARRLRIRQFEDFFNPSGLATPDDLVIYEDCQQGFGSPGLPWLQGYARGAAMLERLPNQKAQQLGIHPIESVTMSAEGSGEINLYSPYREWKRLIAAGQSGEQPYA